MMGHRVIGTALAQRCSLERLTNRNEQCVATKKNGRRKTWDILPLNLVVSVSSLVSPRYLMLSHVISVSPRVDAPLPFYFGFGLLCGTCLG